MKSVSILVLLKYLFTTQFMLKESTDVGIEFLTEKSLLYTEPMTVDDNDPVLDKPSEPLRKILMTCDTQNSESDG